MNKKILLIPIIIAGLFLSKPIGVTLYCHNYTPLNEKDTNDFFETCLYRSTMNDSDEKLFKIIEHLPIRTRSTNDFLFYSFLEKKDISKAKEVSIIAKELDYKNGTFDYFGIQRELYSNKTLQNQSIQKDIDDYYKYSVNKNIEPILKYYKNWIDNEFKEGKIYEESLKFIQKYENK